MGVRKNRFLTGRDHPHLHEAAIDVESRGNLVTLEEVMAGLDDVVNRPGSLHAFVSSLGQHGGFIGRCDVLGGVETHAQPHLLCRGWPSVMRTAVRVEIVAGLGATGAFVSIPTPRGCAFDLVTITGGTADRTGVLLLQGGR